jgi:hypothetical protein
MRMIGHTSIASPESGRLRSRASNWRKCSTRQVARPDDGTSRDSRYRAEGDRRRRLRELIQEPQWALQEIERPRAPRNASGRTASLIVSKAVASLVSTARRPADIIPDGSPKATPVVQPCVLLRYARSSGLPDQRTTSRSREEKFPPGIRIGVRARRWRLSDLTAWGAGPHGPRSGTRSNYRHPAPEIAKAGLGFEPYASLG